MARLAGVDLPRDKRVEAALPYIFGIGFTRSKEILSKTGVNPDTRVRDLTEEEIARIREYIDSNFKVEGDLRTETQLNIKRLIDVGTYRGLPVRGQRTQTNARTRKGPKRTVGIRRKR